MLFSKQVLLIHSNKIFFKVKKSIIILFGLFLGIMHINAQSIYKPEIRTGLNFAKIENSELDYKTDFFISFVNELSLAKHYSLQPEIGYSRQGGKGTVAVFNFDYGYVYPTDVNLTLDYLSFGTINKIKFGKFFVTLGPYAEFIVGSKIEVSPENVAGKRSAGKGDDIDFGFTGGVGINIWKGLSFEARAKKGFLNAYDDFKSSPDTKPNMVFQIGLLYSFKN